MASPLDWNSQALKGTPGSGRPKGSGVVDIIGVKPSGFGLFRGQILGQLIDNGQIISRWAKLLCRQYLSAVRPLPCMA